ncbi:MAG: DUF983 domain-containing protein [Bacteroidia bacterium]
MGVVSAFMGGKCPQCREGDVFTHKPFNLKKFREMNATCPSCKVKFESEPGFFWGAMYFSYAYSVAAFIIIGFFYFTFFEEYSLGWYIAAVVILMVLTSTASFRMSRLLMMYIAAPYRKYKGNYISNR